MKNNTGFIRMGFENRKRTYNGYIRHYRAECDICFKRKKNIKLHYQTYHREEYDRRLSIMTDALFGGNFSTTYAAKFVNSK